MKRVLYILGQLADTDVDWLIQNGRRELVPAGRVLIRQGMPIDRIYIVVDGTFSISLGRDAKRELNRLSVGEVFGELSFLDARLPVATVTATEDGKVLAIEKRSLETKLSRDPAFAARFYRALGQFLAQRLRSTITRLGAATQENATDDPDEDDSSNLDELELGGARFDFLLKRLRGL